MKKIKIFLLLLLPAIAFNSGCKKYIEGFDVSPNDPLTVTPPLLLSHCQVDVMVGYTGQLARLSSVLIQQSAGTDQQFAEYADYILLEGDNNNEWNSIYATGLISMKKLVEMTQSSSPHYAGIAKVLMAMELGLATDFWGDIPNREALGGEGGEDFFNPRFDAQQIVIQDIQALLDDAISDLDPGKSNVNVPGSDDFIHGGDVTKWIKTAWVLKARYANRLSKRNASGSATDALTYLTNAGLTDASDDARAYFGTNGNELNQWYAFNISRGNYMKMGKHFIELMKSISDPRLPFFATTDGSGGYSGTAADSSNTNTSNLGTYYGSAASSLPLVSFVEAKFIEAEANHRLGNMQAAADAHNAAVIASVEQVTGATIPAPYLAAEASETAATINLTKIMTHKYIAMFTQPEVWADWRRTNIPALTPNPNGVVPGIPRRLVTPEDERVNNRNAVVVSDLLKPVWWDE
ncbi:MAG: SusD/RagB family nutrient-binding outer membrane lipoprotein [Bacteroidetes bacterium]|nr:MAG: SusD/RagB family nutrient-binding outer membrane lipoprotein [Bacteroidota bacterium]REK50507.1 MAG: SusD/RagB family nutrient-binding outer membrane lipoprotein [Bacteroidota bacterium]